MQKQKKTVRGTYPPAHRGTMLQHEQIGIYAHTQDLVHTAGDTCANSYKNICKLSGYSVCVYICIVLIVFRVQGLGGFFRRVKVYGRTWEAHIGCIKGLGIQNPRPRTPN